MTNRHIENVSFFALGATLFGSLGVFVQQVMAYTTILG